MTTATEQHNPLTGTIYQGYNQMFLTLAPFKSTEWATFLQWKKAGFNIIKGSKGNAIRTFVDGDKVSVLASGKTKVQAGKVPRCYTVFNREQVIKK